MDGRSVSAPESPMPATLSSRSGGGWRRFTSALADEAPVAAPAKEYAGDVAELPDGRWLLSERSPDQRHFALAVWTPGTPALIEIAQDAERDLVEPAIVAPRAVPNRHPSALHDWTYGNLLALDARQSRGGNLTTAPALLRAETMDEDGRPVSLGTAPVEKDGSFFVQATGDRPLRFILLDAAGHPLRPNTAGSGYGVASSASAWAATPGRSAPRKIACRSFCCVPLRRWI